MLLPLFLLAVLQNSRVQSYLVGHLTSYLSAELRTEVSVGSVDIRLFRSVILEDVIVRDQMGGDLLEVKQMDVEIGSLGLRSRRLAINHLYLLNPELELRRNDGEDLYNYQFLIDYFSERDINERGNNWQIRCPAFEIMGGKLSYADHSKGISAVRGFNQSEFLVDDLELYINGIELNRGRADFDVAFLSFVESDRFRLNHASGIFSVEQGRAGISELVVRTDSSDLLADLDASFDADTDSFAGFFNSLTYNINFGRSVLDLSDIAYFAPSTRGINDIIYIEGDISGNAGDINASPISLGYGTSTSFIGRVAIRNILDFPETTLEVSVEEFNSNRADIESFSLPESFASEEPVLPLYIARLGDFSFSGMFSGTPADFSASGELITAIGYLSAEVIIRKYEGDELHTYGGTLQTRNFDLGSLLENEFIGGLTMSSGIYGKGFTIEGLDLDIDGQVQSFEVLGKEYNNLRLAGDFLNRRFSGSFQVEDDDLLLDFNGVVDLESEKPVFDFTADINMANLSKMNIFRRDSLYDSVVSARIEINAAASAIDDLEGEVVLRDIEYLEYPVLPAVEMVWQPLYSTDSIYIRNTEWSADNKHLSLRSDIVDADLHGEIHHAQLFRSLRRFAGAFLPSLGLSDSHAMVVGEEKQNFYFSYRFKDTETIAELFLPSLRISEGSWLNGNFDSAEGRLDFDSSSDMLSLFGRRFAGWQMSGSRERDLYYIKLESEVLMLSDNSHMENLEVSTIWGNDSVMLGLEWIQSGDNDSGGGVLEGLANIYERDHFDFSFLRTEAYVDGDLWRINPDNLVIYDGGRVEVYNLMAYHEQQHIMADGVLSNSPEDEVELQFSSFDMAYTDILLGDSNFEFWGMIDGYVTLSALSGNPRIGAEIFISDFAFNREVLGDFKLSSVWNNEQQAFIVDGRIVNIDPDEDYHPLVVGGSLIAGDNGQHFDLDLELHDLSMSLWNRYLGGFATDFKGRARGRLHLVGPFSRPELTGDIRLFDTSLHIPFLNITYSFEHDVEFTENSFRFENLMLTDSLGNQAAAGGSVFHESFSNFGLDVEIMPDETIIFNTTAAHNELFHGAAFLSGVAHIHGPVNDITMDISARTNRGTRVILPLNYTGDIRENHFIQFVERNREEEHEGFVPPELPGYISLNFDLEVTPEAEVQLMFDTQFGDIIRGRGSGALRLEVSPEGAFNIYGDYIIQDGEYLFSLQNIINKRFRIEQGSNIRWTGDLNDADVALRAAYRLRTSLYDLFAGGLGEAEAADAYRRRIPVETVLVLEEKLFNPSISFEIVVPGGDEQTREMIETAITTDQEMNRQVFSLLVLNRFMPATADQYNTALGYGVGTTSSELLSNQLSNWLSQISSEFDIGVNYRPGDAISSQELELALSTQLFDDRVIIDGNFGVAGNSSTMGQQAQAANQIIGDVNIEVMLSPEGKFRVKAFNRSNTFDIINVNAPYTQGIGFFYRREFDNLGDLFNWRRDEEEGF